MRNYILHLTNEADRWDNASPVGNGYEGLMIYGGVCEERLQYNEESIWGGGPQNRKIENFKERLDYARKLFIEGQEAEADAWVKENMADCFSRINSYEYAGELFIKLHDSGEFKKYNRDIDLINGICTVQYEKDNEKYKREYFASYPAHLICAKYTSTAKMNANIRYERLNTISVVYSEDQIVAESVTVAGNHHFKMFVKIKTNGKCAADNNGISIVDADFIELYSRVFTDFKYTDIESASNEFYSAVNRDYEDIKAEHIADFSSIMKRSDIEFEADPVLDEMTTFIRIKRLIRDSSAEDYRLMSIYWQFGKYLLLGSSRPGTLPANLQGVWGDGVDLPWSSDYHTNINVQMNYWQAEGANISECTEPLFDFMNKYLIPGGKFVARENYKSRGLVVHHLTDIYGFAGWADCICGLWPIGGAWLAYHLWEHYLYTGDLDFLRNVAYEFIRECAEFAMDNLFEGKDGYLHTGPSVSPENEYIDEAGNKVFLAISPTMDIQIIGGLLDFYAECERLLGIYPEGGRIAAEMRAKMVPLQIGKHGQLMEWYKDYEENEPNHRHISHAFGLYPAAQITKSGTPDLFKAIEVTIDRRLAAGGAGTGWSRAWVINLMARLGRGRSACDNVRALFTNSTYYNLFDKHPPFQIDGNFGGSAGMTEMVLQSHEGFINIIPAVPDDLNGSFKGLRARGGVTVSAKWNNCKVERLEFIPDTPCEIKYKVPGEEIKTIFLKDKTVIEYLI